MFFEVEIITKGDGTRSALINKNAVMIMVEEVNDDGSAYTVLSMQENFSVATNTPLEEVKEKLGM